MTSVREEYKVHNRVHLSRALIQAGGGVLDPPLLKYLSAIRPKHWSCISSHAAGLRVYVQGSPDSFLLLDTLSQRSLAKYMKAFIGHRIHRLERIYNKRRVLIFFTRWRETGINRVMRRYFRYKTSVRHVFLMWKYYASSRRLFTKCKKKSCLIICCFLWRRHMEFKKKAFKKWLQWSKRIGAAVRRCFEAWSLWTTKSKLLKCNILKVLKTICAPKPIVISRLSRWYFELWRDNAQRMTAYILASECFRRWKAGHEVVAGLERDISHIKGRRLLRKTISAWQRCLSDKKKVQNHMSVQQRKNILFAFQSWRDAARRTRLLSVYIQRHISSVAATAIQTEAAEGDVTVVAEQPLVPERCDSPDRSTTKNNGIEGDDTMGVSSVFVGSDPNHPIAPLTDSYDPSSSIDIPRHLKIRIDSVSDMVADYERRKREIRQTKGKRIIVKKKERVHLSGRRSQDTNCSWL